MLTDTANYGFYVIAIIFGALLALLLLAALIRFLIDFLQELSYLNKEIKCNHGRERKYWLEQRRKLWLSLIPFYKH